MLSSEIFRRRGRKLVGVLHKPDISRGRRYPAVLFLHGFPGAEKSVDIQRELLKKGIGSFELHFSGAWGSEGVYRFSELVPDARAALKFLAGKLGADPKRLAVFGFSMGGWTALHVAAQERLRAVAAVAPVGGAEMLTSGTRAFIRKAARPLRTERGEALYRDFARSVKAWDPAASAARIDCPLLLVHGQQDDVVPPQVSERIFAAARGKKRLVRAEGAGHSFLDRRPWLTALTVRWLGERLR